MKFYDREKEIRELQRIDDLANETAQFTVLMGRRRTGKTTLIRDVIPVLSSMRYDVKLLAPTGRAARFSSGMAARIGPP